MRERTRSRVADDVVLYYFLFETNFALRNVFTRAKEGHTFHDQWMALYLLFFVCYYFCKNDFLEKLIRGFSL